MLVCVEFSGGYTSMTKLSKLYFSKNEVCNCLFYANHLEDKFVDK